MDFHWFIYIDEKGIPDIVVCCPHLNAGVQFSFASPPTYLSLHDIGVNPNNINEYILQIESDGLCQSQHFDHHSHTNSKQQDISPIFKMFPHHIPIKNKTRYGTYFVQDNHVLYKKDFWNYPTTQIVNKDSKEFVKNKKPIMLNLTPREAQLWTIKL